MERCQPLSRHAGVKVKLEIGAEIPNSAPENVVLTVAENSRTLKFDNQRNEV